MARLTAPILLLIAACLSFNQNVFSQASCSSPYTLNASEFCITGNLQDAVSTGGQNGACTGTTTSAANSVWYKFKATSASVTITLSGLGSNLSLATTYIEVLTTGTCGSLTSKGCGPATSSLTVSTLTVGTDYLLRVYVTVGTTSNPSNRRGFTLTLQQTPSNDACGTPTALASASSCTTIVETLSGATASSPAVTSTCTGTPGADVWYSFVAQSTNQVISFSNIGTALSSAGIKAQLFSGACGTGSMGCTSSNATSFSFSTSSLGGGTLTVGNTYYLRVYTPTATPTGCNWDYEICLTSIPAPANDECAGAVTLTMGTTNSSGTIWGATASASIPAGCSTGDPDDDVWYKFIATSANTMITLSGIGTDFTDSVPMMQVFSGSCGALVSVACAGTTSLYATGLTVGATYFVRVYSSASGPVGTAASGSVFSITASVPASLTSSSVVSGRMNEVFQQTTLNSASVLSDPWEVIYGPDGYLWITEAKGYKVYRMDPATGAKVTILDISQNSRFLPDSVKNFNVQFSSSQNPWPQGGFAGMVLHPKFLDPTTPVNYVYVSYVHDYVGTIANNGGAIFTNWVVRFTYNTSTGRLESPVALVNDLPGSSDHNSQRMVIAPVGSTYYLFYASGDMGAGQYANTNRTNNAQVVTSYEGKILRYLLTEDVSATGSEKWIPSDNPFNGASRSAVWCTGIRNNQGFGAVKINGVDYIYGSSHGPFSDDEINIIEKGKNYGHPIVIGFAADGNYNNAKAGPSASSLPLITSETANAAAIGSDYRDPIFTMYSVPAGNTTTTNTVQYIYNQVNTGNGDNSGWPSEAPSGMEVYTNSKIPGWKNSLLQTTLKGGRVFRFKLNSTGTGFSPSAGSDTVTYFRSVNRFRDVAIAPDGKTIFTIIDKSSITSGPTSTNPVVSACAGCVIKYTFLGYNSDGAGKSQISSGVDVSAGTANSCNTANSITIDATNNNLWVPITGQDGNIVAEIKANGNNLGVVTTSFYQSSGTTRETAAKKLYLDRNITITPTVQPSTAVSLRLYVTASDLNSLKNAFNSAGTASGVNGIGDLTVYKNIDGCGSTITNTVTALTNTYAEAFGSNFVIQTSVTSFSTFYFSKSITGSLPVTNLDFKGSWQQRSALLQWQTSTEQNSAHFTVERSLDGVQFVAIGQVAAAGNSSSTLNYSLTDVDAAAQPVLVLYYRLKLTNLDGGITYSKVISLSQSSAVEVMAYPNPVKDKLALTIKNRIAGPFVIQVSDLAGRVLYSETRWSNASTTVHIDTRTWTAQLYLIKVTGLKGEVFGTQKFEKL